MGAGRPSVPDEIKKARGTLQKCRSNQNKMSTTKVIDVGDPPEWMSPEVREIFTLVTDELIAANVLETVDIDLVYLLCDQYEDYYKAMLKIKSVGHYILTSSGDKKPHPAIRIKTAALSNIIKLAGQLGLSPAARQKIKFKPKENPTGDKGSGLVGSL